MKKLLSLVLAMMLTVLLIPVNAEAAETKKVAFAQNKMTVYVGAKTTLKNTGTAKNVKWTTSNSKVVSVSNKGVITAKKAGKAVITAKSGKNTAKCTVTVKKQLNLKQIVAKTNKELAKAKNFTITAYMGSIKKSNLYMAVGVNIKSKVAYANMSILGLPEMYMSGNKTYWLDATTNKWYYFNSDSDDSEFFDIEELQEGLSDIANCKLIANKTFNGNNCAAIRVKEDGQTSEFYFDLTNYDFVGAAQGSGKEKVIMVIDTKTVVKLPANVKKATYKEFSFQ